MVDWAGGPRFGFRRLGPILGGSGVIIQPLFDENPGSCCQGQSTTVSRISVMSNKYEWVSPHLHSRL